VLSSLRAVEPIVTSGWLAERTAEVAVCDVRWYLDGRSGRDAYAAGHIPGAVWIDLDSVLAAPPTAEHGRHPLPDPVVFAAGLAAAGVADSDTVVAYDDQSGMAAGRLVWMLRILGLPAALLDGGLAAWPGPLTSGVQTRPPATFAPRPWPTARLVTAHQVAAAAADGSKVVLDARAPQRYRGEVEPLDARPGHVPGARNAPFSANLASDGTFLAGAELAERYRTLGVDAERDVVVYCGSGVSACHDLLALERAGFDPARLSLYPGSWSQWAADGALRAALGASARGTAAGDPEGIDRAGVESWCHSHLGELAPPLRYERLAGGHSNLTYLVTDEAGRAVVLRRPPLGDLLPSAHDMNREWRAISALGPTPVPVPAALGYCADPSVTGAPFYVMGFVEGSVLHTDADVADHLDESARRRVGESLTEVAASLHAVDVEAAGIGDLGRPDGYVGRQLQRWYRQYQASRGASPGVDELYADLVERVPAQQHSSLVHGDYRLGNCIVRPDGEVAAVLDWEICTLGDPLADLGYLVATWVETDDELRTTATSPASAPGFVSRAELIAHYGRHSPLDLSAMDFYLAFSFWKLACINQGVWDRYDQGRKEAGEVDVAAIRASVDELARLGLEVAGRRS